MAKNRYRYDASGRLAGYSSDRPPLSHTLRKWIFWTVLILGFLYIVGGTESEDREKAAVKEAYSSDTSLIDEGHFSAGTEAIDAVQLTETNENQPTDNPISQPLRSDSVELSVLEEREINQAIREAFLSGDPVRWFRGYAVPSDPDPISGCRQVNFSDDEKPGWQSTPQTVCPE